MTQLNVTSDAMSDITNVTSEGVISNVTADLSPGLTPEPTPDPISYPVLDLTSEPASEPAPEPTSEDPVLDLTPEPTSEDPIFDPTSDFTAVLSQYMADRGIPSFRALSKASGISRSAIDRLRHGQVLQMQVNTLMKLADFLQVDLAGLVRSLSTDLSSEVPPGVAGGLSGGNLSGISEETFQRSALQTLEPWLLQWSAAATAAQNNPELSAGRLLPLLRPIDRLLEEWGVTSFGRIGEMVSYDPTLHQVMEPGMTVVEGDRVRVRFLGYRYREALLHRAKVSIPDRA